MGINYSKVMCVNKSERCAMTTPIPYPIYSKNVKGKTQKQINDYVCGSGKSGQIVQCCDPFDPVANDIVKDGSLIKVLHDSDGNYKEFLLCECPNDKLGQDCRASYCHDFRPPTQYEKCRARAVDLKDKTQINPYVSSVLAANTFSNCYQTCVFEK